MTLQVFLIGAVFSFLGSVPPGTLNLSVLQLGLTGRRSTALRFALAVSIIEYPYTWIAIQFEYYITQSPVVVENFQLITAVVMTLLGLLNLLTANKSTRLTEKFEASGFRRGILLSILNPLAIPFWIGVTAYLKSQGWIDLSNTLRLHSYILGTSVGAMLLLTLLALLGYRLGPGLHNNVLVKRVPGIVLLALGVYAFYKYFAALVS
jgi:threonine/homoserine/homoserine lactone efflux protein